MFQYNIFCKYNYEFSMPGARGRYLLVAMIIIEVPKFIVLLRSVGMRFRRSSVWSSVAL